MHVFQEHGGLYAYMISSQCIIIALVYGYLRMELKKRSTTLHCTIALHSRFLSHALLWLKILHPTGEMRFWGGRFERTYFDVRVFNPHAKSHRQSSLSTCYCKHKKRAYEQCIKEVEHSSFTLLDYRRYGKRSHCFLQKTCLMSSNEMGPII